MEDDVSGKLRADTVDPLTGRQRDEFIGVFANFALSVRQLPESPTRRISLISQLSQQLIKSSRWLANFCIRVSFITFSCRFHAHDIFRKSYSPSSGLVGIEHERGYVRYKIQTRVSKEFTPAIDRLGQNMFKSCQKHHFSGTHQ